MKSNKGVLICRAKGSTVTMVEENLTFIFSSISSITNESGRKNKHQHRMITNLYGPNGNWKFKWSEQRRIDLMKIRERKGELISKAINIINTKGF